MQITWKDRSGNEVSGRVEAHILPIIEALGLHDTAEFLLLFSGKYLHISKSVQDRNKIAQLYGKERTLKLYESLTAAGYGQSSVYKVPTAKKFLARYLRSKGATTEDICLRLMAADVSVRNWLRSDEDRRSASEKQKAISLKASIDEAVSLGLVIRVPSGDDIDLKALSKSVERARAIAARMGA